MDSVRIIIKEKIQKLLFGHPIPNEEEKEYKPYWHDLETVSVRASHYHATSDAYEGAILDVSSFLDMTSLTNEEKLQQIKQAVSQCEREIRKLNREWKQDNQKLGRR